MSGQYGTWLAPLLIALAMVVLGIRMQLLSRPDVETRCGACGRLVPRGRRCPCSDD